MRIMHCRIVCVLILIIVSVAVIIRITVVRLIGELSVVVS